MTPREYVRRIERLVSAGRDDDALAFSAEFHEAVESRLSNAELLRVEGLLESAAMATDLSEVGNTPAAMAPPTTSNLTETVAPT